ncbi:MAG: UDP-N-acetylmuramoyl-L-alanine--D-glutamate ligase [Planctomycetota bacterium]|nr:MAG: UDP-N-acetylmuramoyl-L-alanine--D-glutamate ligase [Planctomycetota bacterium]
MSQAPSPSLPRVLVMGLGSFGGGSGCVRALAKEGHPIRVTDLRPATALTEALAEIEGLPISLTLGEHRAEDFQWADWVVVNPAVPAESPWLERARASGCRLTTEINLALERLHAVPTLAVTGTHGKSTCAALAAHLLQGRFPHTALAGNLGGSFLALAMEHPADQPLVLELSSFQTERLEVAAGWPKVAAIPSLGADHLDRHGTLQAYHQAKRRLLQFQSPDDLTLLPDGEDWTTSFAAAGRGRCLWLSQRPLPAEKEGWYLAGDQLQERRKGQETTLSRAPDFPFSEPYRMPSLLAAVAGARLLGLPAAEVASRLASFPGLPHRMARLPAPQGFRLVDNGVATHPEPTLAALQHLAGQEPADTVVLVAGGKDKGLDLNPLCEALKNHAPCHLFGAGGQRLAEHLRQRSLSCHLHDGTQAAVQAALEGLEPGQLLLFSPTFASYDEFLNFRERARVFQELCRNWTHMRNC